MQGPLTGQPLLSPLPLQVVNSSLSILPYALCCMEGCKWRYSLEVQKLFLEKVKLCS